MRLSNCPDWQRRAKEGAIDELECTELKEGVEWAGMDERHECTHTRELRLLCGVVWCGGVREGRLGRQEDRQTGRLVGSQAQGQAHLAAPYSLNSLLGGLSLSCSELDWGWGGQKQAELERKEVHWPGKGRKIGLDSSEGDARAHNAILPFFGDAGNECLLITAFLLPILGK